ncbi:hypothetical protein [Lentzea guizhouensis]|nr:hypothetical protein [Lentzea guizhouensis]
MMLLERNVAPSLGWWRGPARLGRLAVLTAAAGWSLWQARSGTRSHRR